ncbi:MAG: hypothetical protein CMO55_03330 [Verrucomicrobiales bacterium]|nr:hypothetical protein [Verrucomicrobiales bacterium]
MSFCTQCGSQLGQGARFCGSCGARVQQQGSPPPVRKGPATPPPVPSSNGETPTLPKWVLVLFWIIALAGLLFAFLEYGGRPINHLRP